MMPTNNKTDLISRARVEVAVLSAFRAAFNYFYSLALLNVKVNAPAQD